MSPAQEETFEGGCTCRQLRYRMESQPMLVHCCHCRWCQRESGAAFALNALIESDRLTVLNGEPEFITTPSLSGKSQRIARCPHCMVALWSHYGGAGDLASFVRVGSLDEPDRFPPSVHIFTGSKQPWLSLSSDVPVFEEYYPPREVWPEESRQRWKAMLDDSH